MSEKTGLGRALLLSYVAVEKFIDFVFFVLLFFVFATTLGVVVTDIVTASVFAVLIVAAASLILLQFDEPVFRFLSLLMPETIVTRLNALNLELRNGIYFFRSLRQVMCSTFLLFAAWACIVVVFYLVSWPFLDIMDLPLYAPVVLVVFSALSLAIPSAPAGIGTMHYAFLLAIRLMTDSHYDADLAVGFIVVLHFFIILFDFLVGATVLAIYNSRLFWARNRVW